MKWETEPTIQLALTAEDLQNLDLKNSVYSTTTTGTSWTTDTWEPTSVTYPRTYKTFAYPATYDTFIDCSSTPGLSSNAAKKEDVEKIERHIEELEEDIAFFEEERKQQAILIASYESRIHDLETTVNTLNGVVASLKSDYTDLLNTLSDHIASADI